MQTALSDNNTELSMKGLEVLLNDKARTDRIYYLKSRWADEREYEDFAEYVEVMKTIWAETSFECLSLNKNFEAVLHDKIRGRNWKVKFNWNNISYKRTK